MTTSRATSESSRALAPRVPIAKMEYWREGVLIGTLIAGLATIAYFVPVDVASNPDTSVLVIGVSIGAAAIFVVALARLELAFDLLQKRPWITVIAAALWGIAIAAQGIGTVNANLYYPALTALVLAGVFGGLPIGVAAGVTQIASSLGFGALLDLAGSDVGYSPHRVQALAGFLGVLLFPSAAAVISQFYERVIVLRALYRQVQIERSGPDAAVDPSQWGPRSLPRPKADAVLELSLKYGLKPREISVYILLMHGHTAVEIAAADLHLTEAQVRKASRRLREKIGKTRFLADTSKPRDDPTRPEAVGLLTAELTEQERPGGSSPSSSS